MSDVLQYIVSGSLFLLIILTMMKVLNVSFFAKEKERRSKTIGILLTIALFFIYLSVLIITTNNSKSNVVKGAESDADLLRSDVYQYVFYSLTFFTRLTIFALIAGTFYYLLRKTKKNPTTMIFNVHRILLAIGVIAIAVLFAFDIKKCVEDTDYANVISFGLYGAIFVGGIFWMFICSIIAAIATPENKAK